MANPLSSAFLVAPRAYSRHQRHRVLPTTGNKGAGSRKQFTAFLAKQATRLASTSALIFAKLPKNTADRVKAASTFGSLT